MPKLWKVGIHLHELISHTSEQRYNTIHTICFAVLQANRLALNDSNAPIQNNRHLKIIQKQVFSAARCMIKVFPFC